MKVSIPAGIRLRTNSRCDVPGLLVAAAWSLRRWQAPMMISTCCMWDGCMYVLSLGVGQVGGWSTYATAGRQAGRQERTQAVIVAAAAVVSSRFNSQQAVAACTHAHVLAGTLLPDSFPRWRALCVHACPYLCLFVSLYAHLYADVCVLCCIMSSHLPANPNVTLSGWRNEIN